MPFEQHPINLLNQAGAPNFVTVEAAELLASARAYFEQQTGRQLGPSQTEMYLLETVAYMLSLRGAEEQLAFENAFVAYARGEYLDVIGADRNTPRLDAAPATTTLRFEAEDLVNNRLRIPAGTRVSGSAGQVQFLTLDVAYIEVGQLMVDVAAQAVETGPQSNDFAVGSLASLIDPVLGIASVQNLTETGGGAAREAHARYRARLPDAFERIGYGLSRERYAGDVLGWNARTVDVDVQRPQPGYVDIYPLMDTGAPNEEELASLRAVFTESNIHQGDFIHVFAPTAHAFSFQLVLTLANPDADVAARNAVQTVLDDWTQELGGYIAPSELIRAARSVEGVIDADTPDLALEQIADNAWRNGSIFDVSVSVI